MTGNRKYRDQDIIDFLSFIVQIIEGIDIVSASITEMLVFTFENEEKGKYQVRCFVESCDNIENSISAFDPCSILYGWDPYVTIQNPYRESRRITHHNFSYTFNDNDGIESLFIKALSVLENYHIKDDRFHEVDSEDAIYQIRKCNWIDNTIDLIIIDMIMRGDLQNDRK